MLSACDHHLLPCLVATWQDDAHLVLVMEFVQGGEVLQHSASNRAHMPKLHSVRRAH